MNARPEGTTIVEGGGPQAGAPVFEIFDIQFSMRKRWSTGVNPCDHFYWSRKLIEANQKPGKDDVVFYTCLRWACASEHEECENKFAWSTEPPEVYPGPWEFLKINNHLFKAVFTDNKELLDRGENFKYAPGDGPWIEKQDFNIYEKSKLVSMIASKKNTTYGHRFRIEVIDELESYEGLDLFGKNFESSRRLDYKLDGLKDYAFSIAMENVRRDYSWSEKILDCFATGTVPIYWGCDGTQSHPLGFDFDGMLIFNTISELKDILKELDMGLYQKMLPSVRNNFEIMKRHNFYVSENYIYENYKDIILGNEQDI